MSVFNKDKDYSQVDAQQADNDYGYYGRGGSDSSRNQNQYIDQQQQQHQMQSGFNNFDNSSRPQQMQQRQYNGNMAPQQPDHYQSSQQGLYANAQQNRGNGGMNMQSSNLGSAHYAPQNYGRQGPNGNVSSGGSSSNLTYSGVGMGGAAGSSGSGGLSNRNGEEEFRMESDDFPALPGSSSSSAQQQKSSGSLGSGSGGPSRNKDQQQLLNRGLSGMASSHLSVGAGNSGSGSGSAPSDPNSGGASQSYFSGGSGTTSILDAPSGGKGVSAAGAEQQQQQHQQQHKPMSSSDIKSVAAIVTSLQQRYQQQMSQASPKELKFGMGGLLEIIKSSENSGLNNSSSNQGDRNVSMLALGSDLTTFGLNLNSQDPLFPKFISPFNDQPIMAPDPSFNVPQCYVSHPPTLKAEHLLKVQLETLFHMFYNMPRDILQAYAAQELYRRSWRFHETLKLWLKKRAPDEVARSNNPNMQWACFDISDWQVKSYTPPPQSSADVTAGFLSEEAVRVKGGQVHTGAPIAVGSNVGGAQNNGPPVTVGGGAMVQPSSNGQQQQQQPPPGGGVVGGHHS